MTRIDSVRHAADVTKDSVRHAAEVAAPYASTAKENAVLYGRQYGRQAGAYGRQAGILARQQYDARLASRVDQAREQAWAAVPPKAATAVETAARRTAEGAKTAADYTVPKVETAVAATRSVAVPAKDEVVLRGGAALQALRGQVSATDIDRLVRRKMFRAKAGRTARDLALAAVCCGAAFAAWKWWNKQNNPEWLVEPSEATEMDSRGSMNGSATLTVVDPLEGGSVNGSKPSTIDRVDGSADASDLDAEVRAKQDEADRKRKRGNQ
ncbi:hypothetical protein SAMN05216223_105166 [Actinacidiphila yanglinensis]|uniref:Uncharacterized protein n=1 Tax=Actinacidiphila yanglinensis TaxID=310779 RepID=A0A1H6A5F4_9ACTN|nr:DUF5324 family protein [Actinacidiphila yanglinensis]SEG43570.1 hypothetical protein SAMN05216223_105166 [Actinacidiphila yanglinensis]